MADITHPLNLTMDQIDCLFNLLSNCNHFPDRADPVESGLMVAVTELYEEVCVDYEIGGAERAFYDAFGYYPTDKDGMFWPHFRIRYKRNHGIKS